MTDSTSKALSTIIYMLFISFFILFGCSLVGYNYPINSANSIFENFMTISSSVGIVLLNVSKIFFTVLSILFLIVGFILAILHWYEVKKEKALLDKYYSTTLVNSSVDYIDYLENKGLINEFSDDININDTNDLNNLYSYILANYFNTYNYFMDKDTREFEEKIELLPITKLVNTLNKLYDEYVSATLDKDLEGIGGVISLITGESSLNNEDKVKLLLDNKIDSRTGLSVGYDNTNLKIYLNELKLLQKEIYEITVYKKD